MKPTVHTLQRRIRRSFHHVQRGMTLLEMMIVLAILAIVMGLLVGPSVFRMFIKSQKEIAAMTEKKYVNQAFPAWAMAHPGKHCPDKLEELSEFMDSKDTKDPWGGTYKMYCGSTLPPNATGLAVSSPGEDGKDGTPDDIKSWE